MMDRMNKLLSGLLVIAMVASVNISSVMAAASSIVTIGDDFSTYTESNAPTQNNPIVADSATAKTIVQGDGFQWQSSKVFVGKPADGLAGKIYMRPSGACMMIYDRNAAHTTANFVMDTKEIETVKEIRFETMADQRVGLRIAVSADEKSYLELGTGRGADSGTLNIATPYALLGKTGTRTVLKGAPKWEGAKAGDICEWTVKISGNVFSVLAQNKSNAAHKWTYTYTDSTGLLANFKYPFAAYATGDGTGTICKVEMDYTKKLRPDFYDYFDGYNTTNSAYGIENAIMGVTGTQQQIAVNNAGRWILSGKFCGNPAGGVAGKAYIDNSGNGLIVADRHLRHTVVNLVIEQANVKPSTVKFRSADAAGSYDIRRGARFAVSADENTYYEFGTAKNEGTAETSTTKLKQKTPYVIKSQNGVRTVLESPSAIWASNACSWEIAASGDTLSWKVTDGSKVWESSVIDSELEDKISKCSYPISAFTLGDGSSAIKDVEISYVKSKPIYVDNGDGSITVEVNSANYSQGDVTVIVAYYAEGGELLTVANDTFSGKKSFVSVKSTEPGSYGKIFIWQDGVMNLMPLIVPIDVQ